MLAEFRWSIVRIRSEEWENEGKRVLSGNWTHLTGKLLVGGRLRAGDSGQTNDDSSWELAEARDEQCGRGRSRASRAKLRVLAVANAIEVEDEG